MSEQNYLNLLNEVLETGTRKKIFGHDDKYIYSCNGATLKFNLSEGFPLFTTRKIYFNGAFKEMLWFIKGSENVIDLHKSGCKWWDDWGLKRYNSMEGFPKILKEEYEKLIENGELQYLYLSLHYTNITTWSYRDGYGDLHNLDQTKWVIDEIKKNPFRKSYLVNYWNPINVYQMAEQCDEESVVLPACHFYHQVLADVERNKLNLIVGIRSSDLFLGLGANIAQYALLLHMYAHCLKYDVGQLIIQLGDYHIYSDHIEQVKEMILRTPTELPTLKIKGINQQYLQDFVFDDFKIENYDVKYSQLKGDLTVVGGY